MGHPLELLEKIDALLERDYPKPTFLYRGDNESLPEHPGIRPDRQIFRKERDKLPICVVEIGYTRPEKLAEYRRLGIPDVRWYSKEGELFPVVRPEAPVPIRLDYQFTPHPDDIWYEVELPLVAGNLCEVAADQFRRLCNDLRVKGDAQRRRAIRALMRGPLELAEHLEEHEDDLAQALSGPGLRDEPLWALDEGIFGLLCLDQFSSTTAYSNGRGVFIVGYCDLCDSAFFLDEDGNPAWTQLDEFTSWPDFCARATDKVHVSRLLKFVNEKWEIKEEPRLLETSYAASYMLPWTQCDQGDQDIN